VGSAGLWSNQPIGDGSLALAAASLEGLGAWTSIEHVNVRTDSVYEVYQRKDDRWEQLALREGLLLAYYAAFVERDGSLLALKGYSPDPSQEVLDPTDSDPKAAAYRDELERELGRVGQGFVHIGGAKAARLPEIPEGTTLTGSVATASDGSLLALASERTAAGEGEAKLLLSWRQGQTKAERVEVPDLVTAEEAELDVDGEHVLVFGTDGESESYLAIGHGGHGSEWQRVPVSLLGRLDGTARTLSGAARRPDGELWVSLASDAMRVPDPKPVWRKRANGSWEVVPLPAVERSGTATAFAPDQAPGLVHAAGAVWVVVGGTTNQETEWNTLEESKP
jgi:hypothetical protein